MSPRITRRLAGLVPFVPLFLVGCGAGDDGEEVSPYGPSTISPALDPTYEGRPLGAWVSALASKDAAERYAALLALAEFRDEATPHLAAITASLADPSSSVRWAALETLGRLGDTAAGSASPIIERLADADGGVRRAAARAAGRLGDGASAALIERFGKTEDEARALVKSALVAIGPAMGERVRAFEPALRSDDPALADDAADVLVAIGARSVELLASAAESPESLTVVTAVVAIGRIGPTAGAEGARALEKALTRKGDVRTTALDALLALGAPGDDVLARAAASPDADLAEAARARRRARAPR